MWCGAQNNKYQVKMTALHNIPYAELIQISSSAAPNEHLIPATKF